MSSNVLLRAVGELIRSVRSASGLTQRQLGTRAGIGGKYVSEIERGTRDIPISTLHAIVERGLQLQLDIAFRKRAAHSGKAPFPADVEDVAGLIAGLPIKTRAKIVNLVRGLVELTR